MSESPSFGADRLGFGCAHLPGRLSPAECARLIETALDAGIRHFDIARMYGDGRAEAVLGEIARTRRADMTIVTKAGIAPLTSAGRAVRKAIQLAPGLGPALPSFIRKTAQPRARLFSPAQVVRSLETSLRALQTDHVDALLLHEAAPEDVTDDLLRALEALTAQGKAKRLGIASSAQAGATLAAAHPCLFTIVQADSELATIATPATAKRIIHSVVGLGLPPLLRRAANDAAFAHALRTEAGVDAGDRQGLARLLLHSVMRRAANAMILVSSSQPSHIRRNAALASESFDAARLDAFDRLRATV